MRAERALLAELEGVDGILEAAGVSLVSLDCPTGSDRVPGLDLVPAIMHFQFKQPHLYTGDLTNERKILKWVLALRNQ